MHPRQFDTWTRTLATSPQALAGAAIASFAARDALRGLAAGAAGASPHTAPERVVNVADAATATPVAPRSVCANSDVGDLADRVVGELLD